jgi:hypothetical protein
MQTSRWLLGDSSRYFLNSLENAQLIFIWETSHVKFGRTEDRPMTYGNLQDNNVRNTLSSNWKIGFQQVYYANLWDSVRYRSHIHYTALNTVIIQVFQSTEHLSSHFWYKIKKNHVNSHFNTFSPCFTPRFFTPLLL